MAEQFTVRAWPVDTANPHEDHPAATMTEALSTAYGLATDRKYRQVMVTDDTGIIWAQFNLLWKVIPG